MRTLHAKSSMHPRRIFLVGMMASGKTTIGRQLAALLGYDFKDTDALVEQRAGADISWIFDVEGEDGFRDREQLALELGTRQPNVVVATGGGAVLREDNRRLMRGRGTVVYLSAPAALIAARAARDRRRPLLQVDDVRAAVETLVRERHPLYRDVAHWEVEIEGKAARSLAADIANLLRNSDAEANAAP